MPLISFLSFVLLQPQTQDAFEEGRKAIAGKEYAQAEARFRKHLEQNPRDAKGWFFLGFSLAARQKFDAAVAPYEKAIELGLKQYQSYYQLGYCAHRAGRHARAVEALEAALKLKRDDPDALFHLGASRYALKDDAGAERTLTLLLSLESKWTERARFYRALARVRLGRNAGAREDLEWIEQEGRDKAILEGSRKMQAKLAAASPGAKGWSVVLYEKVGHDSNVLRLPQSSLARPTEQDDVFVTSYLAGTVNPFRDKRLTARLSLLDLEYADLGDFTVTSVLGNLENETPMAEGITGLLTARGERYFLGRDRNSFFWRAGGEAGLRFVLADRIDLSGVGFALGQEFDDRLLEDLDATELGLRMQLDARGLPEGLNLRLRYRFLDEGAEAPDRSYVEHDFRVRGEVRLDRDWRVRIEAWTRLRDYDGRDRFFGRTRDDVLTGARAGLYFAALDFLQVFAEVEYERNGSNISDFDYDRTAPSLGFLLYF